MNNLSDNSNELIKLIRQLSEEMYPQKKAITITLESSLTKDLGIDSLGLVELLARIEKHFGIHLGEQVLATAETPRDLLHALSKAGTAVHAEVPKETLQVPLGEVEAEPVDAKTLIDVLEWHTASHGERRHITFYNDEEKEETITYNDLMAGAQKVAAGLLENALQPGQSVAIMLPSGIDYFFSFFGVILAGGVPVPLYPPARLSQIEDHMRRHAAILNNALAPVLITIKEAKAIARLLKGQVEPLQSIVTVKELISIDGEYVQPKVQGEEIAFIQYTSGTTGTPKGVALTHANLLANIRSMGMQVGATSKDVFVSWLPLYHDMGLIGAWLGSLYFAMELVLMSPLAFLARPERWLQAIQRHGGTISGGPNFCYELCLRRIDDEKMRDLDLSSWRMAFNGAEPVSPETLLRFTEQFKCCGFRKEAFMPVYGLAESSVGLAFPPVDRGPHIDRIERETFMHDGRAVPVGEEERHALRFVSAGQPLPGHEIRIVDANGREVGDRKEGRLEFKGPSATEGYFRNPEATSSLIREGWLDSGDFAYVAEGEVYLTGRSKDIIIRGGRNIYPDELEEAIGNIPGIRKGCVAAFGSKDPKSETERLIVLAETRETEENERERLRKEINALSIDLVGLPPEDVVLAPPQTVMKTSSGKIRRTSSRELYEKEKIGSKGRAVWLQFVRLALGAILPQLRSFRRSAIEHLYAGYAWTVFMTLAIITWSSVAIMPNLGWRRKFIQMMARLAVKLTGTRLEIRGLENIPEGRSCVLIANHASYLDGIILTASLPPRFSYVAKRDLKGSFIPRLFLRRIASHFVERFDLEGGLDDARYLSNSVRKGIPLAFFPEGTFGRMPGLRPFLMGAFTSAAEAGVPVVPVAIRGNRSMLRALSWFPRRGNITVTIGEPISPDGSDWKAAIKLRDAARAEILRHCGEPDLA